MSKYTTELRYICESLAGLNKSKGYDDVSEIIETARPLIFDFDFPIFDEEYRSVLETKIIRHFYTREIGEETYGLWKLHFEDKMNLIMPYYNKLYESELLHFDPLTDVNYTKTGKSQNDEQGVSNRSDRTEGESITTVDSNSISKAQNKSNTNESGNAQSVNSDSVKNKHWDAYSDTPQGALTNVDNNTYLTNARKVTDDNVNKGTSASSSDYETQRKDENNSTNVNSSNAKGNDNRRTVARENRVNTSLEDYTETMVGKVSGISYAKLLKEFRDTFLNIDFMIMRELESMFMGLW